MQDKVYFCIDMKCFFASVECAERGLNPFETNLVVADETRGGGTICLAITPKMKSMGIKNRCRLYEIPKTVDYIIAKPRMKKYIEYAADIYETYIKYVSPEDIHVYSIDESFIDATEYLSLYGKTPKEFAKFLIDEVALNTKIPATAGIGTNLYLAKIALDITAKHCKDHLGYLDETLYKQTLWEHKPITDFWGIAVGTAKRLASIGIFDMKGVAECSEKILYKKFGINAEILIDHAFGKEPCTIGDIKNYKSKNKSVSSSQILFSDYDYKDAKTVLDEMTLSACEEMMKRDVIAKNVGIGIGYSKNVIPSTGGTVKTTETTCVYSIIKKYVDFLYDKFVVKDVPIRRLSVSFGVVDKGCEGYDLFTDYEAVEKEKSVEKTVLELKQKFGKNAILRATDLEKNATAVLRNTLIGGHNGE